MQKLGVKLSIGYAGIVCATLLCWGWHYCIFHSHCVWYCLHAICWGSTVRWQLFYSCCEGKRLVVRRSRVSFWAVTPPGSPSLLLRFWISWRWAISGRGVPGWSLDWFSSPHCRGQPRFTVAVCVDGWESVVYPTPMKFEEVSCGRHCIHFMQSWGSAYNAATFFPMGCDGLYLVGRLSSRYNHHYPPFASFSSCLCYYGWEAWSITLLSAISGNTFLDCCFCNCTRKSSLLSATVHAS